MRHLVGPLALKYGAFDALYMGYFTLVVLTGGLPRAAEAEDGEGAPPPVAP